MYVPALYVGLLLADNLTPVEARNHLQRKIVNAAAEAACWPVIDWLRAAIVRFGPNIYFALVVLNPSAPLPDALLLHHRHRLLLSHLPSLNPSINRVAGTRISEIVGEVALEMRERRIKNKRVWYKKENKGAADYFGANLAQLLNLVQVTDAKDLSPVLEALTRATKHQKLLVFQRTFDMFAEDMGLRSTTIATPSLLKLVLALVLQMDSQDNLTTGFYPFVLGQHTATIRKFLLDTADRYAMVASGAGDPYLADVEILLAPNGVTLSRNFSMARGQWLQTWLIVGTCSGVDHNASEGLKEFEEEMSARETDLEEYIPQNAVFCPQVPALILRHAEI